MRVYKEFIQLANQAAGERGMTVADFCERYLTGTVERAHREYIESESKRIGSKE